MEQQLLTELTRIAHSVSPEAREWIGRHIHEDQSTRRRARGAARRGIAVRFPKGGSGVLSEVYVRENGIQVADHGALRAARHRGNGSMVGRLTREAIAAARAHRETPAGAEVGDGAGD